MQRVEIITGRERRRRWSVEEKARLVAKAFAPGAVISHVARRHGVAESCLYAWRKRLTGSALTIGREAETAPLLMPVSVQRPEPSEPPAGQTAHGRAMPGWAAVTLPDGTRLEIGAGYPLPALQVLIAALRSRP
jgi:transposase